MKEKQSSFPSYNIKAFQSGISFPSSLGEADFEGSYNALELLFPFLFLIHLARPLSFLLAYHLLLFLLYLPTNCINSTIKPFVRYFLEDWNLTRPFSYIFLLTSFPFSSDKAGVNSIIDVPFFMFHLLIPLTL